jgi:PEP-CTERM/exosortase A-associated glycosyltransferase
MRVIHVLDHSVPLQTAYASRTIAMLSELRALGWETFHITGPKQGPGTLPEEQVNGWHFYRCPPPGGILEGVPVLGEIELMGEIAYRIEQVAKRVRPHLVHAHSPVLNAIPALRVARRLGIPTVYEVRSFWEDAAVAQGGVREGSVRYRASRALESWVLKRADAVITVNEGLRRELLARGVPPDRLSVIPHAAQAVQPAPEETALRRGLGLEGAFVLGLIGPLYAYEGAAVLLEALPQLLAQDSRTRALLIGGGPEEPRLRQLCADLGVSQAVVFASEVPENEIPRYCAFVDILVSPRLPARITELVTPVKILEALARGMLVLASDVGGHRELIRPGETGVLFRAGDPQALAAALSVLKHAPERAAAIRAAARRHVETERNWKANAAAYQAVYARLTELPPRR